MILCVHETCVHVTIDLTNWYDNCILLEIDGIWTMIKGAKRIVYHNQYYEQVIWIGCQSVKIIISDEFENIQRTKLIMTWSWFF